MRLVISPCPNDVWIFAGWIMGEIAAPEVEVTYVDVQTANHWLLNGVTDVDIMKVSYGTWGALGSTWVPLRSGGAMGYGCGPLLLENRRGSVTGPFLVPGENTTANILLDTWLTGKDNRKYEKFGKQYFPFDALYERLCTEPGTRGVVIHEGRFTYEQDGLSLVTDLGTYWEEVTGAPIPLGLIVHRAGLAGSEGLNSIINESLCWARQNPERALTLCAEHARDMRFDVMQEHIALYVNAFTEDIGTAGERAISALETQLAARATTSLFNPHKT